MGEPEDGFQEVSGEREGGEDFRDGFGGEIDVGDGAEDDTGDGFFTQGDEDELTGAEPLGTGIGEDAAALAENRRGYYLEKHDNIIA